MTETLLQSTAVELHSARRRHHRELAELNRLRGLVVAIDEVILACEETHLLSIKKCSADLKERQQEVLAQARRAVSWSGSPQAIASVDEQVAREVRRVTDVMDSLWIVQEVIFDLIRPSHPEPHHVHGDDSGSRGRRSGRDRHAA
jgi:phage gp29-like protein